jgi:thiamine-monophosphate kinase
VKGVKPQWAIFAIGLPRDLPLEGSNGFDGLIEGLRNGCKEYGVAYLGGDLGETKELTVSMTVAGEIDPKLILRRNAAKLGDYLYTSGEYGLTGLGFALLLKPTPTLEKLKFDKKPCIEAVLNPKVDPNLGPTIAQKQLAHAGADSSDGLLKTIDEICVASNIGVDLVWDQIPLAQSLKQYQTLINGSISQIESLVLEAGEEFHHVFTVDPKKASILERTFPNQLHRIGTIQPKEAGKWVSYPDGNKKSFQQFKLGYEHFQANT